MEAMEDGPIQDSSRKNVFLTRHAIADAAAKAAPAVVNITVSIGKIGYGQELVCCTVFFVSVLSHELL